MPETRLGEITKLLELLTRIRKTTPVAILYNQAPHRQFEFEAVGYFKEVDRVNEKIILETCVTPMAVLNRQASNYTKIEIPLEDFLNYRILTPVVSK